MVAVLHVTDYGIMNLWAISVSSVRRFSHSPVFVRSLFSRPPSTEEAARGTRKREESKNVIYTWNEKAVSIVQTTPVISDYDN